MKKTIIGIIIGLVIAFPFIKQSDKQVDNKPVKVATNEQYPFLAKRIFLDDPNDTIVNFIDLRLKIKDYVGKTNQKTGVYFEYLPTGVNIGVNDRDEFYRASLIKLPLVMRAYKLIEDGVIKKDEMLTVRRDLLDETYGDLGKVGGGTTISFQEVVNLILTKSDNTAYNMLLDRVNSALKETERYSEKGIDEVYDFFDIPRSDLDNAFQVTPKSYSSILKSLYFSSYLTYDSSNEIIDVMSQSSFKDSLPKFIPNDVKVAHKTGTYEADDQNKNVHSDCGIVYLPNRSYILCIMVNSSNEKISFKIISEISKIVYDYVSKANK